jgi:flagellar motor switch protein FliG
MPEEQDPLIDIPGKTKAAVLLACLGAESASRVMAAMSNEEVDELTLTLSSLETVQPETRTGVMDEFFDLAVENKFVTTGGLDFARGLLEGAFGPEKTIEILTRLQSSLQEVPFEFLKKADPSQIVTFLQDEHPQTISLILAHVPPETAAVVIAALSSDVQSDVITRIATMERTPPEVVREVERVLERKMTAVFTQGFTFAGGVKEVAEILNSVDRSTEKTIMTELEENDPELADEIARLMFTFDDIIYVEDSGIQKALREIESADLALALKGSNDEVSGKVLGNMSERAKEMILEEIEFMGPVRLRNVEEAQQKIVAIVRRLEESGELIIEGRGGGGDDEIVV